VAVNHQAEMVEHYLGNGDRLGVEIRYLREQEPLGTVGAVRLAKKELSKPFPGGQRGYPDQGQF
jgi:NDP-sugar pyrophosphorylase family protein